MLSQRRAVKKEIATLENRLARNLQKRKVRKAGYPAAIERARKMKVTMGAFQIHVYEKAVLGTLTIALLS